MPRLLPVLLKAVLLGTALGLVLHGFGLPGSLGSALAICAIFSLVMWGGFAALRPWTTVRPDPGRTPYQAASIAMLTVLLVYTALLAAAVGLVRLATGLDLLGDLPLAILTFLIGFAITAFLTALHTTAGLVVAERVRARLEVEDARKSAELEAARRIQLSLLPAAPPALPDLRIAVAMRTATEVGGDYYDFKAEPGALLVAFGDATGHGLEAGMMVTAVKALVQNLTPMLPLPASLLRISEGVHALGLKRMNMALTLARIEGRRVHLASGGMPPAQHFRAASGAVEEVPLKAPPLGQLSHFPYPSAEVALEHGDRLLFCSDGFPECMDPSDRMLGYAQVARRFQEVARFEPEEILEGLLKAAEVWAGGRPFQDDVTFLILAAE